MIENFVELCDSLLILYGEYGNQIHGNYLTHWNSFFYVLKKKIDLDIFSCTSKSDYMGMLGWVGLIGN